jgi:hypothetical protein
MAKTKSMACSSAKIEMAHGRVARKSENGNNGMKNNVKYHETGVMAKIMAK